MSVRELQAHPDLVTRLDRDAERRCPVPVSYYGGGGTRQCAQPARWRVQDDPPRCGIHAMRVLRRLLAEAEATAGGRSRGPT